VSFDVRKYQFLRWLGRLSVETAALFTLGRMPPMVSTAAIVCRDGDILTIRDTAQGMLVLPGGHLHWRESVEEGLRREVREETGYEIQPVRLLDVFSSSSGFSDRGIIRVIWEARIAGGSERSSSEGAVHWVNVNAAELRNTRDGGIVRRWLDSSGPSGSRVTAL
jgi:ADP-ribose pyrophosphatase YjhB (NUDIX family)